MKPEGVDFIHFTYTIKKLINLFRSKKTGGKKVSSMLKKLIKELLTDIVSEVPVSIAKENLKKASKITTSNFLQLFNKLKMYFKVLFTVILILGKLYLNDIKN